MTELSDLESAAVSGSVSWPRNAPDFLFLEQPWAAIESHDKLALLGLAGHADLVPWIERLSAAHVAADRHHSPDLMAQLTQAVRRPVDSVLCSVLDVDPAACLSSALAARYPIELVAGALLIGRITRAEQTVIVTDLRLPSRWLAALRRACSDVPVTAWGIVNDYPQADPTLLLYSMLNRRLRPGRLPTDQGTIVLDAAAAVAVGRCALLNEPMLQSPLVVRDHVLGESHYAIAPTHLSWAQTLEKLNVPIRGRVLRCGDLLRDIHFPPQALLGSGELILHVAERGTPANPSPCTRCGWCVDACPTRVHPATTLEAAQQQDVRLAERAGIDACIECGVCSYVCPSRLPLLEAIRKLKQLMAAHP